MAVQKRIKSGDAEFKSFCRKLGKEIQDLRKERGLTQEELANVTSLDRVSIGYIEQGIRAPKLRTLRAIAKALKVNVSDLFSF